MSGPAPISEGDALLSVESLGVAFDGPDGALTRAVHSASFTVRQGEVIAIVGESGSGKSVTAMSLLGLVPCPPGRITSGRAMFTRASGERVDLLTLDPRERRRTRGGDIAMIFQEPMTSLNPVMTVGQQIVEAARLHLGLSARSGRRAAIEAMESVQIRDAAGRFGAFPHEFSGGMRQRVMIAMALVCEPRLLIADEPTTALDVTVQAAIMDLLARLVRERSLGVLLITHDLGLVAERADHVCVMYAGHVLERGPAADVLDAPQHAYTRGLLGCTPRMEGHATRLVTIDDARGDRRAIDGHAGAVPWWPSTDDACGGAWLDTGPRRGVMVRHREALGTAALS